jgi:hypothetical protein
MEEDRDVSRAREMQGRRRHTRYQLAVPLEGKVHVREEIAVERWDGGEVVLLSPEPYRLQERLRIEVPGTSRRRIEARVLESRPTIVDDGVIRHRLRLTIENAGGTGV